MIDDEIKVRIRRHYFRDHWKIGTICTALDVHRDTVLAVLGLAPRKPGPTAPRAWDVDPYVEFLRQQLALYPTLTATRLFHMIQERGYTGGAAQVRRVIVARKLRPARSPEAFATRSYLPGEEAQVDWATLGWVSVGKARRPVYAFVMVLPFSGDCWVGFYHDMKSTTVLEAHVGAFQSFGGVPRRILYDNMKTAVLEHAGDAVRYHPDLLALADFYRFEPVACKPRRPFEKGVVERRVRDLRTSMLAATEFVHRAQYCEAFAAWRTRVLHARTSKREREAKVGELVAVEQRHLLPLPREPFTAYPLKAVRIPKQPWVTLDTNQYSVPHTSVGKVVSVLATHDRITVLDGAEPLCTHKRSWDRHTTHELSEHRKALTRERQRSRESHGRSALISQCPHAKELLLQLIDRGESTSNHTRALHALITTHGALAVDSAIRKALERNTPRAASVRMLLEQAQGPPSPPAIAIPLPANLAHNDRVVQLQPLGVYDACTPSNPRRDRSTRKSNG